MVRVVIAGFPADVMSRLETRLRQLDGFSVQLASDGAAVLDALKNGNCSLLVIDHRLQNPPAEEVLSLARSNLGSCRIPVIFCFENRQTGGQPDKPLKELRREDRMLFYPLDDEALAQAVASALGVRLSAGVEPEDSRNDELSEVASDLWEEFKNQILAQAAVLEQFAVTALGGAVEDDQRRLAKREAHKLAGSLGSLGLQAGTCLARGIEELLETEGPIGQSECLQLCDDVIALRNILQLGPKATPGKDNSKGEDAQQSVDERSLLLVVDSDQEEASRLVMDAANVGLNAKWAADAGAARELCASNRPDVVLLDPLIDPGCQLLTEFSRYSPPKPVLVLTSRSSFEERVKVMRLGARAFIEKPAPTSEVIFAATQLVDLQRTYRSKVLAVHRDCRTLESLKARLDACGITVTSLNDPLRFWEALEVTSPDLVLLDFGLSGISGIELCRVLRNDLRWSATPVVFLTEHCDTDTARQLFAAGGDDYISDKISGAELVLRVTSRIDRLRHLRALRDRPDANSVGAHRVSLRSLDQLLHFGRRQGDPLSLVVLDFDVARGANDIRATVPGDHVHRRVASLLARAFRSEDVVSRWEGDEFVVALYGATRSDSVHRTAEILESLRSEEFVGVSGTKFRITLSAGVAEYPKDGVDLQSLYRAAASALREAKAAGGDRVLRAGRCPCQGGVVPGPDVMLVDDDPVLGGLLLHAFQTRGYRAEWIQDGQTALERLDAGTASLCPRVLLLDVDLPSLDGLSVLRRLSERGVAAHTRIIMLTARSSESEVVSALEWGAFDHVSKPFSLRVLMQRVRRALEA